MTVVGAGAVGLTAALALAERGAAVRVVAAEVESTDSSTAAALWAVPFVERSERVRGWAYQTLARFRRDAGAGAGIREQECRTVGVTPGRPDPWTRGFTPAIRPITADELPAGHRFGTLSSIPLIDTSRYLPWLRKRCAEAGVPIERAGLDTLTDVADRGELCVLAAGVGSGALAGDAGLSSMRTQIVRMTNPGLARTTIVRDGDVAPLFIVPRFDDVVIGGAAEAGVRSPEVDDALTSELVERARCIEPALADAEVLSAAAGHRPVRDRLRLERGRIAGRPVVHCYGHGGAGIALSWGTAVAVARLAEAP